MLVYCVREGTSTFTTGREPFQGKLRDLTLQDLGLEWKPCNSQDETPSNFKPDDYLPKSCPEGEGMNGIDG